MSKIIVILSFIVLSGCTNENRCYEKFHTRDTYLMCVEFKKNGMNIEQIENSHLMKKMIEWGSL